MEGGYINEGGQLKTKNGQKYIVNDTRDGIYISKSCAVLTAIIAILTLIAAILATYFIVSVNRPDESSTCPLINGNGKTNENHTVAVASFLGTPNPSKDSNAISDDFPPGSPDLNIINSITSPPEIHSDAVGKLAGSNETEVDEISSKPLKLYEGWIPEMYKLVIEPNLKTSTNNGTVIIDIRRDPKIKDIQPIVLDIHNITVDNIKVSSATKREAIEFSSGYGEDKETYFIKLSSPVEEGESLSLHLDFTSHLSSTLQGIYKTSYRNVINYQKDWVISTQFSPTDARKAFPCFDRPDFKANFSISVVHDSQNRYSVLSNMPSYFKFEHRPGFIKEDFETTPKMPTYIVAFIVSNLIKSQYSNSDQKSPVIEIWTRPEDVNMTKFPYEIARKVLPFYEKYFGMPFKLPKLDLVAIPDFGFGAMENWGLITFRDSALLVPEGEDYSSSAAHIRHVAVIVAHELAHQWFGNLVTPKWWNDLWLKEGFASYMSFKAINEIKPEWQITNTIPRDDFVDAMEFDSDKSAHPIAFPVTSINEIRRIFDSITYSKGTILVRMVNSIIGEEAFKKSVRDLLKKFEYGNVIQDDFWELMTQYGHEMKTLPEGLTIKEIMDSWTLQSGYPILTVERSGKDVKITQERFILAKEDNSTDETKWVVPITFETDKIKPINEIPQHWMTQRDKDIIIHDVFSTTNVSEGYMFLNLHRMGYYRVNYDYDLWLALMKNFKSFPNITRGQILDDAFNLAAGEYLTYDIPLTIILEMFSATDDHYLWASAQSGIDYLTHMLNREPAYELFRAFMRYLVRPAFDEYKLNEPDEESHVELKHRANVARLACKFNYDRCTNAAQLKYREWMRDPKRNPIKPNLKKIIYCAALEEGSYQEWYFALNRYKETLSASEKEQILAALGCTTRPWLLSKYLNMTIDSQSAIRKQDGARAFSAVAKNPIGYEIAFEFLVTNIKEISEYFGDGFSTLAKMINSVTTYMNKEYQKEQLERFAEKAKNLGLRGIERTILLEIEKVKNNIYWRSRSYYQLKGYLERLTEDIHINIY